MNVDDIEQDTMVADLLAKSQRGLENYTKALGDIDRGLIGRWYGMPSRMQADGWVFYRCGLRSSAHAVAIAYMLQQHGWVQAPPGLRCVGFETDAEGGLYLCCPPETYGRMKNIESQARRKRSRGEIASLDGFATSLGQLGAGVEIERMDVSMGQASLGDVNASVTDAQLRSRAQAQRSRR